MYNWWLEADNYIRSTRPTYNRILPYFSRFTVPHKMMENAKKRIHRIETISTADNEKIPHVYVHAKRAYKTLTDKLAGKQYFFGDLPSTLDAIAYAHLALHALPSLAQPRLFSMLTFGYPQLIQFIDKMKTKMDANMAINRPDIVAPRSLYERCVDSFVFVKATLKEVAEALDPHALEKVSSNKKLRKKKSFERIQRIERIRTSVMSTGAVTVFALYVVALAKFARRV
jgi:Glutathione S-transferase, C-terminal domain